MQPAFQSRYERMTAILHEKAMLNVKLLSRHAVGTRGRHGRYVVKAIGLYRKELCLRIAAKPALVNIYAPQIRWAFPGNQRVRMALLEIDEKTKVKVEYSSQEPSRTNVTSLPT